MNSLNKLKITPVDLNLFHEYKNEMIEITKHYADCAYENSSIPIDECMCDCYIMQIFLLGKQAERDLFNGADR